MPLTTKPRPANVRSSEWLVPAAMRDVAVLKNLTGDQLAQLGGLAHAYYRGPDDIGFKSLPLDEATLLAAQQLRQYPAQDLAFLTSSINASDEDLYVFSKFAHGMGTSHLDQWGSSSWSEAADAFIQTYGTPDSTCMPEDILSADLVLLWGINIDEWPPPLKEFLVGARARGAWVILIHPVVPESNERPRSLKRLFHHPKTGTLFDQQISLRPDGHIPFVHALTQQLAHQSRVAEHFVTRHTTGWDTLHETLGTYAPRRAASDAGMSERGLTAVVKRLTGSSRWVSVLGEQFCVPPKGRDAAQGVLNLHLAAGMVGRRGTGILNMAGIPACSPTLRFGIDAKHGPEGMPKNEENSALWSRNWEFPVSLKPSPSANECLRQMCHGTLSGAVLLGPMQTPTPVWNEGPGPQCRVHLSTHLDSSMLAPAAHTFILPMGLGTEASMYSTAFRILHFHHHNNTMPGGPRPAWRTLGDLAAGIRPHLSGHLKFRCVEDIRKELSERFDAYSTITEEKKTDWLQWSPPFEGGRFRHMKDERATFHVLSPPVPYTPSRSLAVFDLGLNPSENARIFLSERDAQKLGCTPNQPATLVTEHGTLRGTVVVRPQRSGCVWAHNATQLDAPDTPQTPGWRVATVTLEAHS